MQQCRAFAGSSCLNVKILGVVFWTAHWEKKRNLQMSLWETDEDFSLMLEIYRLLVKII